MTNLTSSLDLLIQKIKEESPSARFRLQPQLSRLIHEIEAQGTRVKSDTRMLNEELQIEAIEAQFDNVPV